VEDLTKQKNNLNTEMQDMKDDQAKRRLKMNQKMEEYKKNIGKSGYLVIEKRGELDSLQRECEK